MGTLSNNSKVGDKGKDLILQTSGRVYVQVKDRFYEINFRGEGDEEDKEEEIKETSQVLFINSEEELENITYPGNDYLVITNSGKFYKTENEEYTEIPVIASVSNVFTSPVTINTQESPLIISSSQLVRNLNAEYLNSIKSTTFARLDIPQEITSRWTFNSIIVKELSDASERSLIDLENGILSIDTINVKYLNVYNDNDNETNSSNSEFDIINKPTYFSGGIKIETSSEVDKVNMFFKNNNSWDSYNENAEVGGFSIYDLINIAYDNEYISSDISLIDYLNLLTTAYILNESGTWIQHIVTSDDLEEINGAAAVEFMKFQPKDRSIFKTIPYQSSTCAEKIYDRWFNINNYTDEIKAKYAGITYECNIGINLLPAGTIVKGNSSAGILEGLIVGGTETTVRIIVSGTDCSMLYLIYDDVNEAEEQIRQCELSLEPEKGKTTSANLESGNVLFTGNSNNIIGNISGTENSVFGTLEGYGLTSEGNCYFVNPGIALVNTDELNYLKLTNKDQSFIGVNKKGENFITIDTNGGCDMRRENMYNINNHISFCSFGPIVVQEDGSATIGTGDTQITISASGEVKIPSAAII